MTLRPRTEGDLARCEALARLLRETDRSAAAGVGPALLVEDEAAVDRHDRAGDVGRQG